MCGAVNAALVNVPGASLPAFGYRTFDEKPTKKPMFLLAQEDWDKVVKRIVAREKEIYKAKKENKAKIPTSLLPISIINMTELAEIEVSDYILSFNTVLHTFLIGCFCCKEGSNWRSEGKGVGWS